MLNIRDEIIDKIASVTNIAKSQIDVFLEVPKDNSMGDYALPCFKLAKELKKAPKDIADDIKQNIQIDENIVEKIENVNGFLNFYVNKKAFIKNVLESFDEKNNNYGSSNIGNGKNVIVEYSSPNIAKPFHIGHLRTTLIGKALYNIYKFLGYNTIGINHLGDYGTQFGKMIEGYKLWGNEYDLDENPIEKLTEIYVRINNLCKEDEKVLERCRDNFSKLEEHDPYCTKLWEKFKDLSLKEFDRIYNLLDVHFDHVTGEAFYSDKIDEVVKILEKSGRLEESNGAKIIDLEESGISTPCIIQKSNGASIYATRDLAAILYRARTYDFDKCLYVVAYEQNLHFKQIFEVAKLLGIDEKYTNGLTHVSYGMVRLPSGKMSTREGTVVKVEDLLNEAIKRAEKIIDEKNANLEGKEDIAKKVGIGAVVFNDLSNGRIKDEVFDWNTMLNFNGETGPYLQYICVRAKSVIEKAGYLPNLKDIDSSLLEDENSLDVIRQISLFPETVVTAMEKNEPSVISRYLIDLAQSFSRFYNACHIICEDKSIQDSRLYLTKMVQTVLENGLKLLGIEVPDKM